MWFFIDISEGEEFDQKKRQIKYFNYLNDHSYIFICYIFKSTRANTS